MTAHSPISRTCCAPGGSLSDFIWIKEREDVKALPSVVWCGGIADDAHGVIADDT